MNRLTTWYVLSLFAGIGGLDLGLERAGMTVVGQVEIDPFCQRVLAKHWPEVPRHDDVRTAVDWWMGTARPRVDVVCGGFPCQPFSTAGRQQGTADERWGWPWYWDVVRVVRPRFVIVENVAALAADRHAFGLILADLAAGGYDAEWDCIPAAAVGAPHLRDRLFLVAYPGGTRRREDAGSALGDEATDARRPAQHDHQPDGDGESGGARTLANTASDRRGPGRTGRSPGHGEDRAGLAPEELADTDSHPAIWTSEPRRERRHWSAEPDVGRVAHGVPARVDRLRSLGNAVVPQVAEHIGRLVIGAAA